MDSIFELIGIAIFVGITLIGKAIQNVSNNGDDDAKRTSSSPSQQKQPSQGSSGQTKLNEWLQQLQESVNPEPEAANQTPPQPPPINRKTPQDRQVQSETDYQTYSRDTEQDTEQLLTETESINAFNVTQQLSANQQKKRARVKLAPNNKKEIRQALIMNEVLNRPRSFDV
jgi:hypothetical protein